MKALSETARAGGEDGPNGSLRTWHLVVILSVAQIAAAWYLNQVILSDEVVTSLLRSRGAAEPAAAGIETARRWELLSYVLAPGIVVARTGIIALLVQLALLPFLRNPPLASIFRSALWAHMALVAAGFVQAASLARLPAAALLQVGLDDLPGSIASLFPIEDRLSPSLTLLARQVTVFDFAWLGLFALCLEDAPRIRMRAALVSIGVVWLSVTLAKWALSLYLERMG